MGGGGGSKSTSTSSSISGSAQKWAMPFAKAGATSVQSVFNQNQPGLQALTDYTTKSYIPQLQQQMQQSGQTAGQANNYYSDILSGKYMGGNPHLQGLIDNAGDDIMGRMNGQFAHSGRYGSEVHQAEAMKQLANMENQLRYQDYNSQMGRMDSAAQGAMGVNTANNATLAAALGLGAELPYTGSNNLANSLGALFNGGTSNATSTSKQGGGGLASVIGAGLGAAGAIFSDRRLKKNIVKVDEEADGLPIYDYEYIGGHGLPGGTQRGPMADEVAIFRPYALGPVVCGYATIVPGRL